MIDKLLRDEAAVPIVAELFAPYHQFLAIAADILDAGQRPARQRRQAHPRRDRPRPRLPHLAAADREGGLEDEEAAELMRRLVAAA